MSNVKQDVKRMFKGKELVALEVVKQKRKVNGKDRTCSMVKVTYVEKSQSISTGEVIESKHTEEVPGSKKRVLDAFADMYGQPWLKEGSPNYDVPRDLGEGRIFASLVGLGGYKYVNVAYAREIFIGQDGKPFLRTSVGHDVPLSKNMERNQRNLEAARKAFDVWSNETEEKKNLVHGTDMVCKGASLDEGKNLFRPMVSTEVKDIVSDTDMAPMCPISVNTDEKKKTSTSEKDATMEKELLDTISLDPVIARQVGALSSDVYRKRLETQHKEMTLMDVALRIADFLMTDAEEA